MKPERLAVYSALLDERLDALKSKSGDHIGRMTDHRQTLADQADIASEESDREFALRMHEHDRRVMLEIVRALKRIHDGEYGECIGCGEYIDERRLLARPMAPHCIDCQTEMEQRSNAGAARFR